MPVIPALGTSRIAGKGAEGLGKAAKGEKVVQAAKAAEEANDACRAGRRGGLPHQNLYDDSTSLLRDLSYNVDNEFHFPTPEGFKTWRFADIVVTHPDGKLTVIQVGKNTKSGFPVKYERLSAYDIMWEHSHKIDSYIILPYN